MIKLFRNIRKKLIEQSKVRSYFFYAIGEIILVVIGILIALQINNWNQDRLSNKKEIYFLQNLKKELQDNIELIKQTDEIYERNEKANAIGFNQFKQISSIKQFEAVDSLVSKIYWSTFKVNRSTYLEMLNAGSFYSLHNKELRNLINAHYVKAETNERAFLEINANGQEIVNNPALFPIEILLDRFKTQPFNLKDIDTTWIHNPNSKIYVGYFKKATFFQLINGVRRRIIADFIKDCETLIESVNAELKKLQS